MKKRVLIFTSLVMIGAALFAENSSVRKISVDDAVILAADNNISLKKQKLSLDLSKKQKDSSWNSVSPTLSLNGSYGGTIAGSNEAWAEGNQQKTDSLTATASLNLNFTPSLYTSIQSAKLSYEAGEMTYESLVRSVELSVRKSFYSLLYNKENITLQENALESTRQIYESNRIKYNQGRLSELEMLSSQFNYESKRPNIESLKNAYSIQLDTFKQVLGLDLRDEIELVGSLEDAVIMEISEKDIDIDLEEIPSVKTLMKQIEIAKNSLLGSKFSAYTPTVTASASAREDFKNEALTVNYSLGVNIPLDGYLPWSSRALGVASSKTNLESLNLELENTKTSAAIQIRSSYNTILQAHAQLGTYEKNVELMQRTYDMAQRAYNAGSSDLLALQSAADNLASAKDTLQKQRYTIITAVLDLENTLGVPFGTLTEEK